MQGAPAIRDDPIQRVFSVHEMWQGLAYTCDYTATRGYLVLAVVFVIIKIVEVGIA